MDMTCKDRIVKAKVDLNQSKPFFSHILMNMDIHQSESSPSCPTMGVNRYGNLFWNEKFVDGLKKEELSGVLCHEALHMAMLTFERQGSRDMMLWNIATDLVINTVIKDEGMTLPKEVLIPDSNGMFEVKKGAKIKITGRTAEEIYEDLLKYIDIIHATMSMPGDGTGKGDGTGRYKGQIDSHLPGDKKPDGKGTGQDKGSSSQKANGEAWKKKAIEAATAAKSRGTLPASLERELLGILEPEIDWRSMLHNFITRDIPVDFTMIRPGKKYHATGAYLPSLVRELLEVNVHCDVSGSISYGDTDTDGGKFISEAVGIMQAFPQVKMRMTWWGTEVHLNDDIIVTNQNAEDMIRHKPSGGGGTEMSCVKRHLDKNTDSTSQCKLHVWLTDGYVEQKPDLPEGKHLFVISKTGDKSILEKYGEVCKLRRD